MTSLVHAASEQQALQLRAAIARRLAGVRARARRQQIRIVYCKDATRRGSYEHERFTSSGSRSVRDCRAGSEASSVNFLPAIGDDESRTHRAGHRPLAVASFVGSTLTDLAEAINAEVQGWMNFYGLWFAQGSSGYSDGSTNTSLSGPMGTPAAAPLPPKRTQAPGCRLQTEPGLFAHWRVRAAPYGFGRSEPDGLRG